MSDTVPERQKFTTFVGSRISSLESLAGHYQIRKLVESGKTGILFLINKNSLVEEAIVFYGTESSFITNIIDLWSYNPYLKYFQTNTILNNEQGLLGYNISIYNTKTSITSNLPSLLLSNIPDNYIISALHNNIYISVNRSGPVIIKFGLDALPNAEVLEQITYPGISSFLILDRESGKVIGGLRDLPFVVTNWANDERGEYLVITHLADITKNQNLIANNSWLHFLKVIKIADGSTCFEMAGKYECLCSYYDVPQHAIFNCSDDLNIIEDSSPTPNYHLINGTLYTRDSRETVRYSYTTNSEYEWTKDKAGNVIEYYYSKDFTPTKLNCN